MFSIDATFAAAVLVIAAGLMFVMLPVYENEDAAYKMVSLEAQDQARINFYTGVEVTQSPEADDSYYKCVSYWNYSGGFDSGSLEKYTICEGIE